MTTNPERPRYVVDASVAVKWLVTTDDEPHLDHATRILADFRDGKVRLIVPEVIRYEVGHALLRALRRGRLTEAQGTLALTRFCSWKIPAYQGDAILLTAWELASAFQCSYYDSLYLSLAHMTQSQLLYADNKLRNTLGDRFHLALWIEDYFPV